MRVDPEIRDLERECHRIVGMICSESVPDAALEEAIGKLRSSTQSVFPERPTLFDETFGRRFQRLRTRFRPAPGLFA